MGWISKVRGLGYERDRQPEDLLLHRTASELHGLPLRCLREFGQSGLSYQLGRCKPGGRSYSDRWSDVQATYGNYSVTAVYVDLDGGWFGDQTVDFDNTQMNKQVVSYEG